MPAVQVVAAGQLFRAGVFLNAGDAIERLADVDTVVFDKTGTLTLPEGRVVNASEVPPRPWNAPRGLRSQAGIRWRSRLPVKRTIEGLFAETTESRGEGVRAIIDGVEARLGSLSFCGLADAGPIASGRLADRVPARAPRRPCSRCGRLCDRDAEATLRRLVQMGLAVHIVSGDRTEAVEPIAKRLGVASWFAGVRPAGKVAFLEELKANGHRVLMIGDGINDVAALAAAHASLAPISAADISQAQSDAVFLGDSLAPVALTLRTARRAKAAMRQNLALAVVYNAIAVPVAMAGFVTPLIAAAAMSGSSILVTLNALRLRRTPRADRPVAEAAMQTGCGAAMNVLVYLVPMALGLGLTGLFAFVWSIRNGQLDDLDGAALRVLSDDDLADGERRPLS